jgi:type II secretory pathway pseudopilin PulG
MHMRATHRLRRALARQDGFTMIFVLVAMLVGGLLVAAAFTAADGDLALSRKSTAQSAAYYAATAGVERYEYELSHNPNFWIECPTITTRKVPGQPEQLYTVTTLAAKGYTKCEKGVQASVLETSGPARGTFRILITATAGTGVNKTTHKIVATFSHPGFTKYVYETNYEVEDPTNFSPEPTNCEHYYKERVEKKLTSTCGPIQFAAEDKVNGPMHTNDAADLCAEGTKKPTFGREGREDAIEMLGGHYSTGTCKNEANFQGKYTEEAEALLPPETDSELLEAASYKFSGRTVIVLKTGTPNTMTVTNKGTTTTKEFPSNGVVYVENSTEGCSVGKYTPFGSDTTDDTGCGNVYVSGAYTESLTIASADDVIVNGNLTTTHEANGEPTGGGTLGLIAENFVRVYHPVAETYEVAHYTPATEAPVGTECVNEVKESGKLTSGKATITGLSTTAGFTTTGTTKVSGTGVPSGASVKKIVSTNSQIEISANATKSETVTLTFKVPSGLAYSTSLKKCVEAPKSGYTFHESELLDVKACNTFEKTVETYAGKGECDYTDTSSACDAPNETASEDPNKWGSLENPEIDAAILSTKHSWIVDNYKCGEKLGELNVWGSIAQFWRGPVGTGGGSGTGYIKDYNYDQRLFTKEPPSFLSPISTAWKLSRESEVASTFTG